MNSDKCEKGQCKNGGNNENMLMAGTVIIKDATSSCKVDHYITMLEVVKQSLPIIILGDYTCKIAEH